MKNKFLEDKRLIGIGLYLLFLVFAAWFVDFSLNQKDVEQEKRKDRDAFQERFVYADLRVNNGYTIKEYEIYLKNTNTVLAFIDKVREEHGFTYERLAYSYGTEFIMVNGVYVDSSNRWYLYDRDREITYDVGSELVQSDHIYTLILAPKLN